MANLNRHRRTLMILSKATPKAAKKIIARAPASLIKAISEICLNLITGVIPLTATKKKRLGRYKDSLRSMSSNEGVAVKRQVLQNGGFLKALTSLAIPLIFKTVESLVGHIKKRNAKKSRRTY